MSKTIELTSLNHKDSPQLNVEIANNKKDENSHSYKSSFPSDCLSSNLKLTQSEYLSNLSYQKKKTYHDKKNMPRIPKSYLGSFKPEKLKKEKTVIKKHTKKGESLVEKIPSKTHLPNFFKNIKNFNISKNNENSDNLFESITTSSSNNLTDQSYPFVYDNEVIVSRYPSSINLIVDIKNAIKLYGRINFLTIVLVYWILYGFSVKYRDISFPFIFSQYNIDASSMDLYKGAIVVSASFKPVLSIFLTKILDIRVFILPLGLVAMFITLLVSITSKSKLNSLSIATGFIITNIYTVCLDIIVEGKLAAYLKQHPNHSSSILVILLSGSNFFGILAGVTSYFFIANHPRYPIIVNSLAIIPLLYCTSKNKNQRSLKNDQISCANCNSEAIANNSENGAVDDHKRFPIIIPDLTSKQYKISSISWLKNLSKKMKNSFPKTKPKSKKYVSLISLIMYTFRYNKISTEQNNLYQDLKLSPKFRSNSVPSCLKKNTRRILYDFYDFKVEHSTLDSTNFNSDKNNLNKFCFTNIVKHQEIDYTDDICQNEFLEISKYNKLICDISLNMDPKNKNVSKYISPKNSRNNKYDSLSDFTEISDFNLDHAREIQKTDIYGNVSNTIISGSQSSENVYYDVRIYPNKLEKSSINILHNDSISLKGTDIYIKNENNTLKSFDSVDDLVLTYGNQESTNIYSPCLNQHLSGDSSELSDFKNEVSRYLNRNDRKQPTLDKLKEISSLSGMNERKTDKLYTFNSEEHQESELEQTRFADDISMNSEMQNSLNMKEQYKNYNIYVQNEYNFYNKFKSVKRKKCLSKNIKIIHNIDYKKPIHLALRKAQRAKFSYHLVDKFQVSTQINSKFLTTSLRKNLDCVSSYNKNQTSPRNMYKLNSKLRISRYNALSKNENFKYTFKNNFYKSLLIKNEELDHLSKTQNIYLIFNRKADKIGFKKKLRYFKNNNNFCTLMNENTVDESSKYSKKSNTFIENFRDSSVTSRLCRAQISVSDIDFEKYPVINRIKILRPFDESKSNDTTNELQPNRYIKRAYFKRYSNSVPTSIYNKNIFNLKQKVIKPTITPLKTEKFKQHSLTFADTVSRKTISTGNNILNQSDLEQHQYIEDSDKDISTSDPHSLNDAEFQLNKNIDRPKTLIDKNFVHSNENIFQLDRSNNIRVLKRKVDIPFELYLLATIMTLFSVLLILLGLLSVNSVKLPLVSRISGYNVAGIGIFLSFILILSNKLLLRDELAKLNIFYIVQGATFFSIDGAVYYFFTDSIQNYPAGPHYEKKVFGSILGILSSLGALLGYFLYKFYLSKHKYLNIIIYTSLVYSLIAIPNIIIFTRSSNKFITDKTIIVLVTLAQGLIGGFMWIPGLMIVTQICPDGLEKVVCATLAGSHKFANVVGYYIGSAILIYYNILPRGKLTDSKMFSCLPVAAAIQGIIPILSILIAKFCIPSIKENELMHISNGNDICYRSWLRKMTKKIS